jgi:hypothetical protein
MQQPVGLAIEWRSDGVGCSTAETLADPRLGVNEICSTLGLDGIRQNGGRSKKGDKYWNDRAPNLGFGDEKGSRGVDRRY